MWYLTSENNWEYTNNSIMAQLQSFLQELQLWQGESDFRVNEGIDWLGVLNGAVDLENAINQLATKYADYFYVSDIFVAGDEKARVITCDFKVSSLDKDNQIKGFEDISLEMHL